MFKNSGEATHNARVSSGRSKGGREGRSPPPGPKFLHFHAVFSKNWPNNRLAPPPLGLAPPPLGNPGSATGEGDTKLFVQRKM